MRRIARVCAAFLLCVFPFLCRGQAAPAQAPVPVQPAPGSSPGGADLTRLNAANPSNPASGDSTIHLDVRVTDRSGKPITGLALSDFSLLDNGQPGKILSFHAYESAAQRPDSPVQMVILFDTVNTDFNSVSFTRQQVDSFLLQNGGHLGAPTSIGWLKDDGISLQSEPSMDGNALAAQIDAYVAGLRTLARSAGVWGAIERFQFSLRILDQIVQALGNKPGRKLVVWASPGWPALNGPGFTVSSKAQQEFFSEIVELSTRLRQGHIDLYSISQGLPGPETYVYESYLKGVKKVSQADSPNLGLKVLAVQSGGLALPPSNDLAAALNLCARDADAFYSLSFEPPPADGPNEYHKLEVRIDKPGLTARTSSGYYGQPAAR